MHATDFGTTPDGVQTRRFRLVDGGIGPVDGGIGLADGGGDPVGGGIEVDVSDYGATVVAVRAPDRDGRYGDVVLGLDTVAGYTSPSNPYLGATVGRVANRIGGATFDLDGRTHRLTVNEGRHHLHGGGGRALGRRVWDVVSASGSRLELGCVSDDGEEGYPGRLEVTAVFTVVADRLEVEYRAHADRRTPVNLTNHAYFNLAGEPVGPIDDHVVQVFAARFTPTDAELIPTGAIAEVAGTALDLSEPVRLGDRLDVLADTDAGGLDHNFVLDGEPGEVRLAARVVHPASGRRLELHTDQPAVQVYTGNMLRGDVIGRAGIAYAPRTAFCLEPQGYPDAVNQPAFPSVVLHPGEEYRHRSTYAFGIVP